MISDAELWALTLSVERKHGENGPRHAAEMLGAAVALNDPVGIRMWRGVAKRYERLLEPLPKLATRACGSTNNSTAS